MNKEKILAQCPQHDKETLGTPQKNGAQVKLVKQQGTWARKNTFLFALPALLVLVKLVKRNVDTQKRRCLQSQAQRAT